MNGKYNQPTAHMLQPVKGWDSMAHLDFVAPIASKVKDALPGTVMHLNASGELEVGLTPQSMGMYLFYKMWDEDVQPYPLTEDGTRMTAVGFQSFGGYNSEVYLRTWEGDSYNTNGHASNVGAYRFDDDGSALQAKVKAGAAAHTTYPAICGMELSSTEFASVKGDGITSIQYYPNDTLTSPEPKAGAVDTSLPGDAKQQAAGGFLKKGVCYKDPICGIVSKKPVINEHGYKQICFWSTWLPALSIDKPEDGAVLTLKGGKVMWEVQGSDSDTSAFSDFFTLFKGTDAKNMTAFTDTTGTYAKNVASDLYIKFEQTNKGADPADVTIAVNDTTASTPIVIGATTGKITASMFKPNVIKLSFADDAANTVAVTFTYIDETFTYTVSKAA